MILASGGSIITSNFAFYNQGSSFDPLEQATPKDLYFSIVRGDYGDGQIIDGPFSYLNQAATPTGPAVIERVGSGEYSFRYTIPQNYLAGVYTIVCQSTDSSGEIRLLSKFQVREGQTSLKPIVISSASSAVTNFKAFYSSMGRGSTSTLLLIGHSDNIPINTPISIRSGQDAINALGADIHSPLLRGFFDAYDAGARDIVICASAPMSEYVKNYQDRNTSLLYLDDAATPTGKTFYEKYYERLQVTYETIKELDFIDYIVPLEASFIRVDNVDFVNQLADHCYNFHNTTGFVQIGLIGSKTGGSKNEDVDTLFESSLFNNKLTTYSSNGIVSSDIGRFVVPVYGEATMRHQQLATSYTSPIVAAFAGKCASSPLNSSMTRARIPGAMSMVGQSFDQSRYEKLDSIGLNFIYRGIKTKRNNPFEVYVSNEYTLAKSGSTLSKLSQMRIVANCINEIKLIAEDAIGKFAYENAVDKVRSLLLDYKESNIIVDFSLDVKVDEAREKSLIFYINLISALGLKEINFSVAAGPRA